MSMKNQTKLFTKGHVDMIKRRPHRDYANEVRWVGITPTFFALNWATDKLVPCQSISQACRIAFGRNKANCNQDWLACMRTNDYFVCL